MFSTPSLPNDSLLLLSLPFRNPVMRLCIIAIHFLYVSHTVCAAISCRADGEAIFQQKCAGCHGLQGEGTKDVPQPLFGDRSTPELADIINRTMPEGQPEECVGDDAAAVAEYMQRAFYSPEAQARLHPPRVELSRLTVSQYRNAVADLVSGFRWFARPNAERGLQAEYYASRNTRRDRRVLEQLDPQVDFQFGTGSPNAERMRDEEFSMRWQGSVIIRETGWYEFVLKTENAGRLYVNEAAVPLVDAWVRSGSDTEFRGRRFLLGGRIYPVSLEWFKFREKTASVSLQWKPPHGIQEPIPARHLTTESSPQILVMETPFPPDDRSAGYERGTAVSREWDDATTYAAIEAADKLLGMLPSLVPNPGSSGRRGRGDRAAAPVDTKELRTRLMTLASDFAERAFRRPLTDDQQQRYVNAHFETTDNTDEALRRSVMMVLKSPAFLYRELPSDNDAYARASRLSFALLNSIPDNALLQAARDGKLETDSQVREQAWRLVGDARSRFRLTEFLRTWMNLEHLEDIDKNAELYPDFTPQTAADLRVSLEMLLESVVNSETADFRELLTTEKMWMNGRLARFYGSSLEETADFQEVVFEPEQRSGIVAHPYLLSGFSYQTASSPIHRGVFLFRGVLGRALKPPPVAVAPTAPELAPDLTTRERVVLQTSPEMCANCHHMINGLGFTLENFDAVGRYRVMEKNKPVDASGSYLTRSGARVPISGARELAAFLADSEETHRGFARQLFHFLVQQPVLAYGPETIQELADFFRQHRFDMRHLMVEMACRSTKATQQTHRPVAAIESEAPFEKPVVMPAAVSGN